MWFVLTKHLLAKYGAAAKNRVEANIREDELVNPQFTAVYAVNPDERRLTAQWETLQLNVTSFASRVL